MAVWLNEEQVNFYQTRFQLWKELGYSQADTSMIPLLELMNQLPGVATVYCCDGHLEQDLFVMFAVTRESRSVVDQLFERVCGKIQSFGFKHHHHWNLRLNPMFTDLIHDWYFCPILSIRCVKDQEQLTKAIALLEEAVKEELAIHQEVSNESI